EAVTDSQGVARFENLWTASYVARFPSVIPGDRSYNGQSEIKFAVDDSTDRLVFKLTPTLHLRGSVVDELGYPARKYWIWFSRPNTSDPETGGHVDENGQFEATVATEGIYQIKRLTVFPQA